MIYNADANLTDVANDCVRMGSPSCFGVYSDEKFSSENLQKNIRRWKFDLKFIEKRGRFSHTSYNSFNKWTKISSLEIDIFDIKMMVKNDLEFLSLPSTCRTSGASKNREQCSRINHYSNFIAQDFFHFSSLIHNEDNYNV